MARLGTQQERRIGALGAIPAALALAAGAWGSYSRFAIDHQVPLLPAIDATRHVCFTHDAGEISYYAGAHAHGRPLLLLHSLNAAASAYEMRPLFERFVGERPVYAPDLPGFGFSTRADRPYSPALYAAAITRLLEEICAGAGAADVIALSLSSEFAARVAVERPDLVRSLTLISPTGFDLRAEGRGTTVFRALATPISAQPLYDLLVSPPSIRYFLKRAFVGEPDADLVAYASATAHQPGARFAPLRFLGGRLFTAAVRHDWYAAVQQPALMLYDEDGFVRFDALGGFIAGNPHWRARRITPTRGLPQFEAPEETAAALTSFWHDLDSGARNGVGPALVGVPSL